MQNQLPSTPDATSDFTDFRGLQRQLPFYSVRSLRELVRRGVIPSILLPSGRKRIFHIPSVAAALKRYQSGGGI